MARIIGSSAYWRESQRPARFLVFDARVVVFMMLAAFHVRFWTVGLLIAAALLSWVLEGRGVSPDNAVRLVRSWIVGRRRPARGLAEERAYRDYLFEVEPLRAALAGQGAQKAPADGKTRESGVLGFRLKRSGAAN